MNFPFYHLRHWISEAVSVALARSSLKPPWCSGALIEFEGQWAARGGLVMTGPAHRDHQETATSFSDSPEWLPAGNQPAPCCWLCWCVTGNRHSVNKHMLAHFKHFSMFPPWAWKHGQLQSWPSLPEMLLRWDASLPRNPPLNLGAMLRHFCLCVIILSFKRESQVGPLLSTCSSFHVVVSETSPPSPLAANSLKLE